MTKIDIFARDYLLLFLTVALSVGAIGLVTTSRADAYTHLGCKFDGTNPTIDYKFVDANDRTKTAIGTAQANWDRSDSPGYFRRDNGWRDSEIDIFDGTYSSRTQWAWVSWSCDSDGTFESNEVDLTRNFHTAGPGNLTVEELSIVMVHELGHAYGLDHSSFTCSGSGPSVMRKGRGKFACAGTSPWANDVAGVNAIY